MVRGVCVCVCVCVEFECLGTMWVVWHRRVCLGEPGRLLRGAAHVKTNRSLTTTVEVTKKDALGDGSGRGLQEAEVGPVLRVTVFGAEVASEHELVASSPEDERLLERLYCFEDYEHNAHLAVGGRRRRVLVKAHTLLKWRDRGNKLFLRAAKVTAVKVMYAHWNPDMRMFEQEKGSWLKLLPVSKSLQDGWREFYQGKRFADIEWESSTPGSIPAAEDKTAAKVRQVYEQVRAAIQMGERLFPKGATLEHGAMKGCHSSRT